MKQIILETRVPGSAARLCLGRLFAIWALFGAGAAILWRLAGPDALAQVAVWVVCGVAALGLLLAQEV